MSYFDVYLIPIRPETLRDYRRFSETFVPVYIEYDALGVTEVLIDPDTGDGTAFHADGARPTLDRTSLRGFPATAAARTGETIILSLTEWPSKAIRDRALPRILADPRVQPQKGQEPLSEGARLVAGGFRMLGQAAQDGHDT